MECYDLASQGPCPRGEWFVVDKPSNTVLCKPRPCKSFNEVKFGSKCEELGRGDHCQKGLVLTVNIFGRGESVNTI